MKILNLCLLFLVIALFSCKLESKNEKSESKEETSSTPAEHMDDDDDKEKGDDDDDDNNLDFKIDLKQGELIATDKLKGLFPKSFGRLDRTDIEAESSGAFGLKVATVKSEYENGDKSIDLELIDFGGIPGIATAIAAWSKSDIFHEDENGFEKVTNWKGHKAFEKSDKKHNTSSIAILYKNRLLISAKGDDISLEDLKEYLEDDFMDELDDLKIKE